MAKLQPHQEFMILRPRPDIHGELSTICMKGGVIDSEIFGKVKTEDVIHYKHTGMANHFAFGEVLRMGKGLARGPSSELPQVGVGSIIGFCLSQVGISCQSDEGRGRHEEVYFVPFKAALCRFDPGAKLPVPLGNFVMTEQDDVAMARFQGANTIVLPDTVSTRGLIATDNPGTKIRIQVERVVAVGPGKWVRAALGASARGVEVGSFDGSKGERRTWQAPDTAKGEVAVFLPMMSTDLTAYSKRYRFTPWTQVLATLED